MISTFELLFKIFFRSFLSLIIYDEVLFSQLFIREMRSISTVKKIFVCGGNQAAS